MDTIIQSTFIIAAVSAFESSELLLLSSVAEMDNFTVIIDEPTTTTTTTITTTIIPAIPEWIETMRYIKISLLALMFILIFCGNTFVLVALNVSIFLNFH